MTKRAVLYARYSTDRQRETSIDDQLRAARARAEHEGWEIVGTHADEGVSGSTPVALRPGGKVLLAGALAGRFEVLILEGLDRLSRELGEAETMVKRLEHRGVRIIGTADGYDSQAQGRKVMRIARGLVNELYLDDLRHKTHRGLAGNFDRGMSAGGRSYGYRTRPVAAGQQLVIDEGEAAIVREVFELFADGHSVRSIAHQLNQRGVPTARGGTWAVSALQGSAARGLGMLHNRLYIGAVVWNRRQWIKDPDTGKRRYVDWPQQEWQVREDESLRIVPQPLWDAVQSRVRQGPARGTRKGAGRIPRTLFGGLLRCEVCGGPMIAVNAARYGCNTHKDRGPTVCPNAQTVLREALDHRLLAEVRAELSAPEALDELRTAVRSIVAQQRKESAAGVAPGRARLAQLRAEIQRLVEAVAMVGISPMLADRLRQAEAEYAALERQTAASTGPVETVLEAVTARYKRLLLALRDVLDDEDRDRTRAILADMIGPVTVLHEEGGVFAEIEAPAARLLVAVAGGASLEGVAGACNSVQRLKIRIT